MTGNLKLTRSQILAFRRRTAELDHRLPPGPEALQRAAWAGLQDSMPRAALLSIHARMADTQPGSWEDPFLMQIWGPRYSVYVIAERDFALFALSRQPDEPGPQARAQTIAARLQSALAGRRMSMSAAAREAGLRQANMLRYAAATGTIRIYWDGSHQPEIWNVPAPEMDHHEARLELARRYLEVFGPGTPETFSTWAGIGLRSCSQTFKLLAGSLQKVDTPIGEGWILSKDEPLFQAAPGPAAPARLLPSGDTWFLLQGADRELLVPDESQRRALWTSRVWPGALLIEGETAGTWRRSGNQLTIQSWFPLSRAQREAVEAEAGSMPLPGISRAIEVHWDTG